MQLYMGLFLVSLSDSSLLVYKNATGFRIFILYPATLLNSCISSSRFFFLLESLGFSMYSILTSAKMRVLLLSNLNAFYFFRMLSTHVVFLENGKNVSSFA